MRKTDTAKLFGGTVIGMGVVLNAMALGVMKWRLFRKTPKAPDPNKINSVDEMHNEYMRRKSLEWIKRQRKEDMEIRSQEGLKLQGQYIHNGDVVRAAGEPKKVVILSHGYTGYGYKDLIIFADFYARAGFDIIVIDQRSHGMSDGKLISFGALEKEDMIRWVRAAIDKAGSDCEILLHGWSMGAAIIYLAAAKGLPPQVKGLVYDCGYSVMEAQFFYTAKKEMHIPKALIWYILQAMKSWCRVLCHFDMSDSAPLFVARNMKLPIFFVHGAQDQTVPAWMGRKLYECTDHAAYRDMLLVPGADHILSYARDRKGYEEGILKLIDNCM